MLERIEKLAEQFDLDALYLFGSRATEIAALVRQGRPPAANSVADVDVAVLPRRGHRPSVRDKVRLAAALEDLWRVGRSGSGGPALGKPLSGGGCGGR